MRWENPKTGAHGDLTPRASFDRAGQPCRDLEVANSARGHDNRIVLDALQTARRRVEDRAAIARPVNPDATTSVLAIVGDSSRDANIGLPPVHARGVCGWRFLPGDSIEERPLGTTGACPAARLAAFRHGRVNGGGVFGPCPDCPPPKSENSVTLFGGYRWARSSDRRNHGSDLGRGVNTASYALAVDIGLDRRTQVQLFYSRQTAGSVPEHLRRR